MNLSVNALVLRVRPSKESDRLCTLLTDKYGVISAYARSARNIKNKNFTATGQFAYGRYELFESHDRFVIDESSVEELFVPLRDDIERLALGQYLCELACELVPQDAQAAEYLQLILSALRHLSANDRPNAVIKAAAELRLLSMAGYMPNVIMCGGCGAYEHDIMYFSAKHGTISCAECGSTGDDCIALSRGAVAALRHTIYVDLNRVFSFSLGGAALAQLCAAAEGYLKSQTERTFTTLEFYNSLTVLPSVGS